MRRRLRQQKKAIDELHEASNNAYSLVREADRAAQCLVSKAGNMTWDCFDGGFRVIHSKGFIQTIDISVWGELQESIQTMLDNSELDDRFKLLFRKALGIYKSGSVTACINLVKFKGSFEDKTINDLITRIEGEIIKTEKLHTKFYLRDSEGKYVEIVTNFNAK